MSTNDAALRVAVVGASGRMGSQTCQAVEAASDLDLVARLGRGDGLGTLEQSRAQVVVDFTRPDVVMDTVRHALLEARAHVVIGTSGLGASELDTIRGWLDEVRRAGHELGVVVAPNFGIGAVLLMRFAAMAAPFFESVEIVELHHPDKVDAPSGTARHTADAVAAARRHAGRPASPDATRSGDLAARGAVVEDVHVHAVRLRGLTASEEVLLGSPGEVLTLRHDSLDRASFMPGVLLAVREVVRRPGLTVGLEHLLDLPA
ncbi:MAG: 4-hydroxy-tetrahydrodipicolinate reductase [Actinomycetes bacterium]